MDNLSQEKEHESKGNEKIKHKYQVHTNQKYPIINLKIENLNLENTKLNIPYTQQFYYLKGAYPNFTGPYSAKQLEDMYKKGKVDSNSFIKPIDLFCFNETNTPFKTIKVINNDNWFNNLSTNPLLKKYSYFRDIRKKGLFQLKTLYALYI